jgi:small subunit ribosomal protein S6
MRKYEIMLILPADADEGVVAGVTDRIRQTLAERGGEIVGTTPWGRRRLAYPISHRSEGFYLIVDCMADPAAMKELDRVLSLADDVVRFKVVVRSADRKTA